MCYAPDSVSIAAFFAKKMVFIMRVVCLLLSLLLLAACGQKGGLYLPEKKQPTSPTSPNSQP